MTWEPDPEDLGHTHPTGGAWYALRWQVNSCPACNPDRELVALIDLIGRLTPEDAARTILNSDWLRKHDADRDAKSSPRQTGAPGCKNDHPAVASNACFHCAVEDAYDHGRTDCRVHDCCGGFGRSGIQTTPGDEG